MLEGLTTIIFYRPNIEVSPLLLWTPRFNIHGFNNLNEHRVCDFNYYGSTSGNVLNIPYVETSRYSTCCTELCTLYPTPPSDLPRLRFLTPTANGLPMRIENEPLSHQQRRNDASEVLTQKPSE